MKENRSTTISATNGEKQNCVLQEKINNGNGKLLYRFHNEACGDEYLLAREGNEWEALNDCRLPPVNIKELTDFADTLDEQEDA